MHFIWGKDMWQIFWLLFVFCPQRSVAASLSCNVLNYLEIKEGREDNTFTCTGLTDQQTVTWLIDGSLLHQCPPVPPLCTASYFGFISISRTSNKYSDITINSRTLFDLNIIGTSLSCQAATAKPETCQLDLIYPAENSTCYIEFDGDTWTVKGWCTVPKLKSTRFLSSSGCTLYQTFEKTVGFYKMNLENGAQAGYYSGTCNMTSDLPPEGKYNYTVIILPGEVNVSTLFNGSNEIRQPKGSLEHNCPLYVTAGDDLTCQCSISNLGSPPGRLKWNNTASSLLSLRGLKREQHGVSYVCSLTWNRTVQQSLTYTLIITYPPTQLSFKLNNNVSENVVVENTTVTMLCQSDGRPAPNMTITHITNGNRVVQSLTGGNVTVADQRELGYIITAVQCEASGEYRCSANNAVGQIEKSVTLYVKCNPRRNFADTGLTPPAILTGKNASFELIAYPTSVNVTKYFLGSNNCSCESQASVDVFRVDCTPSSQAIYKITCTVTVMNVTSYTAGLYKAVASNELGSIALIFEALPRNSAGSDKSNDVTSSDVNFSRGLGTGLGIGLGIAAAEAVVVATVVLVFCWRRQQQTSRAKGGRDNTGYSSRQDTSFDKASELTSSSGREHESAYEAIGSSQTGQTAAYTNVQESHWSSSKTSNKTGNVYDGLHLQDVGVSSHYASLT